MVELHGCLPFVSLYISGSKKGISWNSSAAVPITLVEIPPRVIRRGRERGIPGAGCHFEETGRSHAEFLKGFRRLAIVIRSSEGIETDDTSEESLACLKP